MICICIYIVAVIYSNDSSNANGWYIYIYYIYMCVYKGFDNSVSINRNSKTNYTRACVNPSSLYNIIHRWAAAVVDGVGNFRTPATRKTIIL